MSDIPWDKILQIIAYILMIIAGGGSTDAAIASASAKFGYSESQIRRAWDNH